MNSLKSKYSDVFNEIAIETDTIFMTKGRKQKYSLILQEKENINKNGLVTVELEGFDNIYLVVKYDKCNFLDTTAKSLLIAENIKKACDYIAWVKFQDHKLILLIELKSKNNEHTTEKFKSTKAFISYLKAVLTEYKESYIVEIFQDFIIIPLLINQNNREKRITPYFENGIRFYHIGINNKKPNYIQNDFEQILEIENR